MDQHSEETQQTALATGIEAIRVGMSQDQKKHTLQEILRVLRGQSSDGAAEEQ